MPTAIVAPLFEKMPNDHSSQKKLLRRGANAHGLDSAAERHRLDREMAERYLGAFPPDKSKIISFFWPMAKECDTRPIAEACHAAGMVCALPVIKTDSHGLLFRRWSPDAPMFKSTFGTMQPTDSNPEVQPDILLVPLVMADLNGARLGRGAGHYDATLGPLRRQKPIMAIGVAYDWQVSEDALPVEGHDERLDGLITPTRVIIFP